MSLIAKIHIARKQLAMVDDEYRSLLEAETGLRSCAGMSQAQLASVLAALERRGFKPRSTARKSAPRPPHVRLVYALWGDLQSLGAVTRGPKGAPALRAFVNRQAQVAAPEFLTAQQAHSVVEALKSWIKREKGKSDAEAR
jgi:phage gp16-like protein